MDNRSCLILQRAREAASLVLNLRTTHTKERRGVFLYLICISSSICTPFYNYALSVGSFFFFVLIIFLSLPEEVVLHISNFLYDLLLPLAFPWEELSVLEVVEHDSNKAHLIIGLERKNKKYS